MDFFLLLKTWSKILVKKKISENVIRKYKLKLNQAKQSATDALKTISQNIYIYIFQKTPEATGYLTANKIANKITKVSRPLSWNSSRTVTNETENNGLDGEIPKETYMFPEK